jgi:hypothetical protein
MANMAANRAADLYSVVLEKLNERSYRPIELFQQLQNFDVSESALKDVLAALLEDQVIELSPDRHIQLRHPQPSGTANTPR